MNFYLKSILSEILLNAKAQDWAVFTGYSVTWQTSTVKNPRKTPKKINPSSKTCCKVNNNNLMHKIDEDYDYQNI